MRKSRPSTDKPSTLVFNVEKELKDLLSATAGDRQVSMSSIINDVVTAIVISPNLPPETEKGDGEPTRVSVTLDEDLHKELKVKAIMANKRIGHIVADALRAELRFEPNER